MQVGANPGLNLFHPPCVYPSRVSLSIIHGALSIIYDGKSLFDMPERGRRREKKAGERERKNFFLPFFATANKNRTERE